MYKLNKKYSKVIVNVYKTVNIIKIYQKAYEMRLERRLETTGKDVIGSFHCQRISRINTILKGSRKNNYGTKTKEK